MINGNQIHNEDFNTSELSIFGLDDDYSLELKGSDRLAIGSGYRHGIRTIFLRSNPLIQRSERLLKTIPEISEAITKALTERELI